MRNFITSLSLLLLLHCNLAEWIRKPQYNGNNNNNNVGSNRKILEELDGLTLTSCYLRCKIREDCQSVAVTDHSWLDGDLAETNSMKSSLVGKSGLCILLGEGGSLRSKRMERKKLIYPTQISDINECEVNEVDHCQQICVNTPGSFICQCKVGYVLGRDGRKCNDIDECEVNNNGGCEHTCVNKQGSYQCSCRRGYSLHTNGTSCEANYEYMETRQTWDNAERECIRKNGHLLSINDDEEEKYVLDWLKRSGGTTVWLGFNDKEREGVWEWTDGSSTEFRRWRTRTNEPNGKTIENCGQLFRSGGTWNDVPCSHLLPYVCEKNNSS